MTTYPSHTNRLAREKSPYLLQHAHNPVDWYAWSEEAFQAARDQNKPIFLSIGYATCHWCHVMEKESFEDEEASRHLNETFVCIKVDREERPDIDAVYMAACQMMSGSGGWPLTIFMTPDKKPFFAATYLPKQTRFGRIGLMELCQRVQQLWQQDQQKVLETAHNVSGSLGQAFVFQAGDDLDESVLETAHNQIEQSYDPRFGGFLPAPKFPTPHRLLFLLRCYHRSQNTKTLEMVEKTLQEMRLGGIWDHVGFGFHRYSTDQEWLLPHFEKMLYDQALLALAYVETFQITRNPFYAHTAEEIFTYVLRDMTHPQGGFFAAEDADSEGEEGKFYVWHLPEFEDLLGSQNARYWGAALNLSLDGNFHDEATRQKTGANIPHLKMPAEEWMALKDNPTHEPQSSPWDQIRRTLFEERVQRIHPLKDDKILTDWNGLMIAAFARGARVMGKPGLAEAAKAAENFLHTHLRDSEGQLYHRYRDGDVAIAAQADDYGFLIFGLIELYQATFDPVYLDRAIQLQDQMTDHFWDFEKGGFFLTAQAESELPVRPKELYDGAIPSANSISLLNLLCLTKLTGNPAWEEKAQALITAFAGSVKRQPSAFTQFLIGLDFALFPGQEIVVTGDADAPEALEMLKSLNLHFAPNQVTLFKSGQHADTLASLAGYTANMTAVDGRATAHICKDFSCKEPTSDINDMLNKMLAKR